MKCRNGRTASDEVADNSANVDGAENASFEPTYIGTSMMQMKAIKAANPASDATKN